MFANSNRSLIGRAYHRKKNREKAEVKNTEETIELIRTVIQKATENPNDKHHRSRPRTSHAKMAVKDEYNETIAEIHKRFRTVRKEYKSESSRASPSDTPASHERNYLLGSGIHPSNINHPLHNMLPVTTKLTTATATSTSTSATHRGSLQIPINTRSTLCFPAILNPDIRTNFLSVHEMDCQYGSVLFTPDRAYILKSNKMATSIEGTGTFINVQ